MPEPQKTATQIVHAAGWKTTFLDDGYGPSGWWAYKGLYSDPDKETGIFDTEEEAAQVALECFPDEFAEVCGKMAP